MVYSLAMVSIGLVMWYAGVDENLKCLVFIGLLLYFAGLLIGASIEDKFEKRIKELEKKQGE